MAEGIKLADEIYNQFNLKFFPAGNTGNQMGGWFNKRIVETKDFKGLKFRMPGLGGEVLKVLELMLFFCPVLTLFQQFLQEQLMELNGLALLLI